MPTAPERMVGRPPGWYHRHDGIARVNVEYRSALDVDQLAAAVALADRRSRFLLDHLSAAAVRREVRIVVEACGLDALAGVLARGEVTDRHRLHARRAYGQPPQPRRPWKVRRNG